MPQDTSKAINLEHVNGLVRFRVWSFTNEMSVYLISDIEPAAVYVTGRDIASFGYSFSFTHISGTVESAVCFVMLEFPMRKFVSVKVHTSGLNFLTSRVLLRVLGRLSF